MYRVKKSLKKCKYKDDGQFQIHILIFVFGITYIIIHTYTVVAKIVKTPDKFENIDLFWPPKHYLIS